MTHYPFPEKIYNLLHNDDNYILLETSKFDKDNQRSLLFIDPVKIISINNIEKLPTLFATIKKYLKKGYYAAGWLNYECGHFFEPTDKKNLQQNELAWFGIYKNPLCFNHQSGQIDSSPKRLLKQLKSIHTTIEPKHNHDPATPNIAITNEEYHRKISEIKTLIEKGITYQVNFTDMVSFDYKGSPLTFYQELKKAQPVAYGAFIKTGTQHILSLSPELFFQLKGQHIMVKPMKGTAKRGQTKQEDLTLKKELQNDPKNRAENLMIVDLLRNDLGRIAIPGTVTVPQLFNIDEYPSLFQMTSTITGQIKPQTTPYEIFSNLFPCGSITGAPKVSTMKIIDQLESKPRGIYTGSIGFFSPKDEAIFNVAIRTITIKNEQATMGVGSGIVYDSDPEKEYQECILKTKFLTSKKTKCTTFNLLETILWKKDFFLLEKHLQRMQESAHLLEFPFCRHTILNKLHNATKKLDPALKYKIRVLINKSGQPTIETTKISTHNGTTLPIVAFWPEPIDSSELLLRHKTTHRPWYKKPYQHATQKGWADILFVNEKGEVTEGAISNIFIKKGDTFITPSLESGLLKGTFRQHLLTTLPNAIEKRITRHELISADAIYICNSVRKMQQVQLVRFHQD